MKNFEVKSLNGDYTFFDIETTGTANTDEVIEIAALKIRDDKVIAEFKKLINTNVEINRYAYDLHHISKKMLENESDFKTVISMFVDFIESDVIVGHNIKNFDISFINRNCEKYGIAPLLNHYFDTLPYARECLPQLKCHSLEY